MLRRIAGWRKFAQEALVALRVVQSASPKRVSKKEGPSPEPLTSTNWYGSTSRSYPQSMVNADALSPSDGDYGFNAWWIDEDAGKQDLPLKSIVDLPQLRDYLASSPVAVTLASLSDTLDIGLEAEQLKDVLRQDTRFIFVSAHGESSPAVLPKTALFNWFVWLNLRLATTKQFSLARDHVTFSLNSRLLPAGKWCKPPPELMNWGARLHLVRQGSFDGSFQFPLARVLSNLPSEMAIVAREVLSEFAEIGIWGCSFSEVRKQNMDEVFAFCPERSVEVVKLREGLEEDSTSHLSLEQVGQQRGLTRERIRQIEKGFYESICQQKVTNIVRLKRTQFQWQLSRNGEVIVRAGHRRRLEEDFTDSRSRRRLASRLIASLLCEVLESGDVVMNSRSLKARRRSFLAKCCGIPVALDNGLQVLAMDSGRLRDALRGPEGTPRRSLNGIRMAVKWAITELDENGISGEITNEIRANWYKRLAKTEKVRLTLLSIGKPAHFSEVTAIYNSMWINDYSSERTIHGNLDRATNGIVWVGAKGTFALREWGYEQPDKSLFELASQTIRGKYAETGRPVPFTVFATEMAKTRRHINPSSLQFAVSFNSDVRRVGKDSFVPVDETTATNDTAGGSSNWEQALKEFEEEALN